MLNDYNDNSADVPDNSADVPDNSADVPENSADVPYTSIYSANSTVHSIPANSTIFSVTVPVHDANSGSSEMRGKYA